MARLTNEQWERARAEYEVRGISLGEVARCFGVTIGAVSKKAKKDGWIQGKSKGLVEKKVNAVKLLAEYGMESKDLPYTFRHTIETVAQERLQADGALAEFDVALAMKGVELLQNAQTPEDYELIARGRKHLAPPAPKEGTTVNVTQQQAQGIQPLSPKDALAEIVMMAREEPDNSE